MRWPRQLAGPLRGNAGTSAIEFALIAPVLATFAVGIADLARGMLFKFELEQASYSALEQISVGADEANYDDFLAKEAKRAATASGQSDATTAVKTWRECNGAKQEKFNDVCANSTDEVAKFVEVTITSSFEPMFKYGPLARAFGGDAAGKIPLTVSSSVRVQ